MKYQLFFLNSILIVLLCFAVSCKKSSSEPENPEPKPEPIPTSVTDIEGNEYAVKRFGGTLWMMENLRVTKYDTKSPRSGDSIPKAINNHAVNAETPYYKDVTDFTDSPYTDNLTNEIRKSLGFLYNWSAAAGTTTNNTTVATNTQGICPNGWQLPTATDFDSLCHYVGGRTVAAKKLKSMYGWYTETGSGTNESEMNCYPAGLAAGNLVSFVGKQTMFWSSNNNMANNTKAEVIRLFFDKDEAEKLYINKIQANSVRCVKKL